MDDQQSVDKWSLDPIITSGGWSLSFGSSPLSDGPDIDSEEKATLDETPRPLTMINLDHPCYGVDVWDCKTDEDVRAGLGQGYVPLEFLRALVKEHFKEGEGNSDVKISYYCKL